MTRYYIMVIFVMIVCAVPVHGRMGESPDQCAKRYGAVVVEKNRGAIKTQTYRKSCFKVTAFFMLQKRMLFAYEKAAAILYCKSAETEDKHEPLAIVEIKKFLEVNSQGEQWTEVNFIKNATETKSDETRSLLIADGRKFRLWTRKSGAKAYYIRDTHELFITSTDKIPIPKQQKPDYLDGF